MVTSDGSIMVDFIWNVMAHGDARKGKWRGNWRMEWVASTLHTISEHGVSSITTADAHTSAASSRLNWRRSADLNGLVRFAERRNVVSARVPSHFNWPLNDVSPRQTGRERERERERERRYIFQNKVTLTSTDLWRFFSHLTTFNSTAGEGEVGRLCWTRGLLLCTNNSQRKVTVGRLSIRALSIRADAPRLGSMLCRLHRYGPYCHRLSRRHRRMTNEISISLEQEPLSRN